MAEPAAPAPARARAAALDGFRADAGVSLEDFRAKHGDAFLLVHDPDIGGAWSADTSTDAGLKRGTVPRTGTPMPSITVFALLPPPAGEPLTVGRSSSADVQLPHASVSRSHATLRVVDGRWVVHDGRSSNGTFVGETAAHAPGEGDPTPLVQGQAVRFGDVNAVFLNADGLQRLVASARALRR